MIWLGGGLLGLAWLWAWIWIQRGERPHRRQPGVSILMPFRSADGHRDEVFAWLREFWQSHLPDSELIVGSEEGVPFSKAAAVNQAASRARGRIYLVIDADAYLDPARVQACVAAIEVALKAQKRLWFIPYLRLYRLTEAASKERLRRDPRAPYLEPSPPDPQEVLPTGNDYGHQFGALIMVMPAQAFWLVGGFDPRMRGWGGEDGSFMRALDTLYALHETSDNDVLHLWHEHPGQGYLERRWQGQRLPNANSRLAQRYALASGDPTLMRALLQERAELEAEAISPPPQANAW